MVANAIDSAGAWVLAQAGRAARAFRRGCLAARYWWTLRRTSSTMTTLDPITPYTLVDIDGQRCIVGRPRRSPSGLTIPILPVRR